MVQNKIYNYIRGCVDACVCVCMCMCVWISMSVCVYYKDKCKLQIKGLILLVENKGGKVLLLP